MDPITISLAVGVASKAFEAIKSGFALGRDLESMSGDLSRWMGASSDIDNAEKQAKNPGVFGKVFGGGSIEATALQAYTAKKKLEEQRYELKMFLNMTHGPQAYDELLAMEGKIRKQRQETVYKQQQLKKQIVEIITWLTVVIIIGGFTILLVGVWMNRAKADVDTQPKTFILREESIK
jgi:hypothetical protein|tara:strand:- start:48 stop:584 length:537 start_codon:yes stop_codon:yes gene_type:complete